MVIGNQINTKRYLEFNSINALSCFESHVAFNIQTDRET